MRIQRTYYEVMGLPRTATPQEIKSKYHDLARQFHPDRAQDKVVAERLFVQINLAYRTLMDSDKRAVYDASLFQADAATSRVGNGSMSSAAAAPSSTQGARPTAQTEQARSAAAAAAQPQRPQINVADAMNRANAAYMGGDRITAHKLCMDILRSDPRNGEAHALVGDIYSDQGRRQEALAEYRTAAEAGGASRLLQEKIKRMEMLSSQPAQQAPRPSSSTGAAAPSPKPAAQQPQPEAEKKGSFIDRLIGRRG